MRRLLPVATLLLLLSALSASASPQSFARHDIRDDFDGARSVYATDVDGDGDVDVLSAAYFSDQICWWENTGGTPPTFVQHYIRQNYDGAHSVHAADLDGDGDVDVLGAAAAASQLTWWENKLSGNAPPADPVAWTEHTIDGSYGGVTCVYAADMDGDDDVDVLSASNWEDDITFWQNAPSGNPSNPISWTEHTLRGDFDGAISVFAIDVDGDGHTDALGTARDGDEISWWENSGGAPPTFTEHSIRDDLDWALCVHAADLDDDGDVDVLGCGHTDNDLLWWENTPSGSAPPLDPITWIQHTIDGDFGGVQSVYVADLDSDGDMDVVGAAYWHDLIAWYENDGEENFTKRTIQDGFDGGYWVHVADMDADDDLDVLAAADKGKQVTWWENLQDFSMSSPAPHQTVLPGNAALFDVTVTSENGFSRQVDLALEDLPVGWQDEIDPNPVTPTGTSHLTVTVPATSTADTHLVHVIGTSGVVTHSITLTLDVQTFTISSPSLPQTILPRNPVSYTLTLTAENGFNEPVMLSASGLPTGCEASFDPDPALPTCQSLLTIDCAVIPPAGSYTVVVRAEVDSLLRTTGVVVNVPYRACVPLVAKSEPECDWWGWWDCGG